MHHACAKNDCPQWNQRLFLEAWYSNKEENSINAHVYTSISGSFRTFLEHALCIFVTFLPIAILTVTSPIVINVPTRGLLAVETKDSFVLWLAKFKYQKNCL